MEEIGRTSLTIQFVRYACSNAPRVALSRITEDSKLLGVCRVEHVALKIISLVRDEADLLSILRATCGIFCFFFFIFSREACSFQPP